MSPSNPPSSSSGSSPSFVGIDLGGTKLFGALVEGDGKVSEETYLEHGGRTTPVPLDLTEEERALGPAYARLVILAADLIERGRSAGRPPVGVGVGAPGMTRPEGGVVIAAGTLGWKDVHLGALLERRCGLPVRVENDVNLTALGEHAFGAGRGLRSLFLFAIGTGIGGGLVVDGKLWRGRHYAAGEIGALLPGREYLSWNDRDWGAFEAFASGTGLSSEARRLAGELGATPGEDELRGERLFAAAAAGAPWARRALDQAIEMWTIGLAAVQAVIDPDLIVLSGGVAPSAAPYLPLISGRLRHALPFAPEIVTSTLGYRAAILGVPALFR
jgi:glucokinase